jgi:PBP1b-binding outer membrane lipoprotein LpoB
MKTPRALVFSAATLGLVALISAGCSKEPAVPAAAAPAPTAVPVAPVPPVVKTVGEGPIAGRSVAAQDLASWEAIKDFTFDQRAQFLSGAGLLQSQLAGQVSELNAHRATMTSGTDTKDWDFAMKEMNDSQSYLKSMIDEASQATAETWAQEKEKVDQAWQRAEAAFDKVKVTTTS